MRSAQFGDASADKEIGEAFEKDFKKAEVLSLPITLMILLSPSARSSPPACRSCSAPPR